MGDPGRTVRKRLCAIHTNNLMELTGVLEALRAVEGDVLVMSDSTYVVDAFTKEWVFGWEARGWRKKGGEVPNADLWRSLLAEYRKRIRTVRFEWVRGHAGDRMNDVVDRLANEAAVTQQSRSSLEPPTTLGLAHAPVRHTRTLATAVADKGDSRRADTWSCSAIGPRVGRPLPRQPDR